MTMVTMIIDHPHSMHDRTKEWLSCCAELSMGRDPKWQRFVVEEDDDDTSYGHTADLDSYDDDDDEDEEDSVLGCYSSPECLAINMIDVQNDNNSNDDVDDENLDSWMRAALALSASIDEVSLMIQRKATSYVSSTDTLNICFNNQHVPSEGTMTNADRSILETTVASFAAGMAKQIDSLRQTVVVEGDHPFLQSSKNNGNSTNKRHNWASGPIGHRAAIASCLMIRLKSEIMEPMTKLQSQREKAKKNKMSGGGGMDASEIAQNPMRLFQCLRNRGEEGPEERSLPPAPWEVGGHDAEKDRAEREQETEEFFDVYFGDNEDRANNAVSLDEINANLHPPAAVLQLMDLPTPISSTQQQSLPTEPTKPQLPPKQQIQNIPRYEQEEEEHFDQLQRESATLLATYQHSDLEGVQKVEKTMVEITTLLSQFTDLITEQQEDIFMIHDQAIQSKKNVEKGQDQLVDAANRGEKSRHPMATFVFVMALLLLLFNWITP